MSKKILPCKTKSQFLKV